MDVQRPRYLEPRVVDDGNRQIVAYEEEDNVLEIRLPHRHSPVQLVRHDPIHTLVEDKPVAPTRRMVRTVAVTPGPRFVEPEKEFGDYSVLKPRFTVYQKTMVPLDELGPDIIQVPGKVFAVREEIPVDQFYPEHRALRRDGVLVRCPRVDPEVQNADKEVQIIRRSRGYELRSSQKLLDSSPEPAERPLVEQTPVRYRTARRELSPTVKMVRK